MQVDQRGVFGSAAAGLVQALAIQAQCGFGRGKQARGREQVRLADAAGLCNHVGCAVAHGGLELVKAAGVFGNKAGVHPAFPQQGVQHAVEQHDIGARLDRQEQVGNAGRIGAARIAEDDLECGVGLFGVFNPAKQDGVGERGVRADDENALRMVHVVVAGRGRVGAQRLLVARHGAAHAQARIGVDVVGAQQALGELVEGVIVFGKQLARDIQAHGIRAVRLHDALQGLGGSVQRLFPGYGLGHTAALHAP